MAVIVGFTADSGLFVMVREHRISALFPNTFLIELGLEDCLGFGE